MNNLKVEYLNFAERPITAIELMKLYKDAGWWKERREQDIEKMLKSVISIGAWKDGTLIGFARAISDGKFRAYVEDVVIDNAFQNSGIGTNLVSKLLEELSDIDVISLFCEEHLIPFYTKTQFKLSKSQFVMHRK
ncbi:GNAT family N-acetyltransferase [Virgibacillus alimentarius]|uniref:Ribosomal protein S18 acetylase RimI-like enzyme n=1 Tax=Virgibacillus alimentarius TaxID=698769 RepID=A0ABS4S853_9BACI|nr:MULTISPECIES: GNAT family N-acetyltransferase [Virgibacillus]MBP2257672.1 ribosomal protein S18 acetylase RimI-like enzyme [Virgibacillus alimentarius]HLR69770.1 GNAT family N-acetyltransferase [Virgibacillus sp.]